MAGLCNHIARSPFFHIYYNGSEEADIGIKMKLLYNLGILLYYGLVYVASFFNDKAAKFVLGRKDVFSYL